MVAGAAFLAFSSLMMLAFLFAATPASKWCGLVGFSPFLIVGATVLLRAIRDARRQTVLLVTPRGLRITQTTLAGTTDREIRREAISAIRADVPPGHAVHPCFYELQIHTPEATVSLLNGQGPEDLQWLATELRKVLSA